MAEKQRGISCDARAATSPRPLHFHSQHKELTQMSPDLERLGDLALRLLSYRTLLQAPRGDLSIFAYLTRGCT